MVEKLYIVFHYYEDFEFFYKKVLKRRDLKFEYFSAKDISSDFLLSKKSRVLPLVALVTGILGIILAIYFQFWTNAIDQPMNLSGKPFFSLLISIPATFEFMVIVAVLSMLISFLILSKPGISNQDVRNEIKKLISEGKSIIKVNSEIVSDDLFRKYLLQMMDDEKIIVHKKNE